MKKTKEISPEQKETAIRHSTNNIIRSVVLTKRAVNTLTFANESLEDTEAVSMAEDIGNAKRSLADAIRSLSKYTDNEEKKNE
jgi:hypothetical protein